MLRNVAIPLMLAASEAEAQTPEQIKAAAFAMKMDKDWKIPELVPASDELNECQEGTNDTIAQAVSAVATKKQAVEDKKALYEADVLAADATATPPVTGGPWTIANNARQAAVQAAEAAEAPTTALGVLLDSLNGLHELERAAAKTYYDASVNVANGVIDAAEKLTEYNRLNGLLSSTLVLKNAADAAVLAATTAITDEETSRNWLYCELGAVPAFNQDSNGDGTADYVPFTQDLTGNGSADETLPTSWHAAQTPTVVALPPSCTVPRVLSAGVATPGAANANEGDTDGTLCSAACAAAELAAAGTCASSTYDNTADAGSKCMFMTETRPEIKYFNTQVSGGAGEQNETNYLTAETNVLKWNATLALTQAQATLTAATGTILPSTGIIDRTTAGKIAYYEGLEKKYKWLKVQRTREEEFFRVIKSGATNALGEANNHIYKGVAGTGTTGSPLYDYVIPASGASEIYGWPSTWGSSSDITNDTLAGSPSAINRFTANYAGASKGLAAAVTARDRTTAWVTGEVGSKYRMHSTRTNEANGWAITVGTIPANSATDWDKREYVSIWTNTPDDADGVTDMNAWTAAQNTATATNESALYKWWKAAYGASKIANDWALLFTNAGAKAEWVASSATATKDGAGSTDVICDGTLTNAPWQAASGGNASQTACQAECVNYNKDVTNGIAAKDTANALRTWGTGVYIPRETTGGSWCTAYSYAGTNDGCHINVMAAASVNVNVQPASQTGAWGKGTGSTAGKCMNMTADTDPGNSTTATTNEMLNFAALAKTYPAAYDLGKQDDTAGLYAAMVADVATQAGLETAWLQAYYYHQYWLAIQHMLTTTTTGKAKSYNDYHTVISASTASNPEYEKNGVTNLDNANMVNLQAARNELAYKQVDIALKTAHVTLLGSQINRVQQQIEDLRGLTAPAVTASSGISARDAGELIDAQTKRQATYDLYNGVDPDYSASLANTANTAASDTLVERNFTTHPLADPDTDRSITLEGDLAYAKRIASEAWSAAQQNVSDKADEITAAESTATLASLRTAVETTGNDWDQANIAMKALRSAMTSAMGELAVAEQNLVDETLACQVAAYDKYRQVLDEALQTREDNLATIKNMLEGLDTEAAPGTAGSRCEKALSNGTYRPKRGEETCGGKDSGLCCGGARVWMKSGTTEGAGWRTIETCQLDTTETYAYQPPREPMSVTMPTPISTPFACIEGAKALAAAASAAAAAVYMLA